MYKTNACPGSSAGSARSRKCVFDLMERLRAMPDEEYVQYLVAYHAAPTLKGIKPATLICPSARQRDLPGALASCQPRLAELFGVEVASLYNRTGAMLLLIYQPALLRDVLDSGEVEKLLAESGYDVPAASVDEVLASLGEKCANSPFPHEIGVFLGYPASDVRRFMRGGAGRPCCAGCWKAWDNAGEAEARSARFRAAKTHAAELIVRGASLGEMAEGLRLGA